MIFLSSSTKCRVPTLIIDEITLIWPHQASRRQQDVFNVYSPPFSPHRFCVGNQALEAESLLHTGSRPLSLPCFQQNLSVAPNTSESPVALSYRCRLAPRLLHSFLGSPMTLTRVRCVGSHCLDATFLVSRRWSQSNVNEGIFLTHNYHLPS